MFLSHWTLIMRIASIHLPSFPLQIHVRTAPHLAGKAFAITTAHQRVLCCSRKAWMKGVRSTMTVVQARALAPDTLFLNADLNLYRQALIALAESLLTHSTAIDIGNQYQQPHNLNAHASIYLRVPPKRRAQRYGERLLAELRTHGYRARAGIADDRFTAWVAAVTGKTSSLPITNAGPKAGSKTTSVPLFEQVTQVVARGGSAAYLKPLTIELLPLTESVRSMLSTLGVHTLGEFAALPAPTVNRPRHHRRRGCQSEHLNGSCPWGLDYQRLARGLDPSELHRFTPAQIIVEHIQLNRPISTLGPLSFMLRPLADRICKRLTGRGLAVTQLLLFLQGPDRDLDITRIEIKTSRPTLSTTMIVDLARAQLSKMGDLHTHPHPICELRLQVRETAVPELDELDLFDYRDVAGPEPIDTAVARLRATLGDDTHDALVTVGSNTSELDKDYRLEPSFKLTPFVAQTNDRTKELARISHQGS